MQEKNLREIKEHLRDNLWRIIDKKAIIPMAFREYLMGVLIRNNRKIVATPISFLDIYARQLRSEYAAVLDYLEQNIIEKSIFDLEKYIIKKVNGSFSYILTEFLNDYAEA